MPSRGNQSPNAKAIDWLAIFRASLVQLLVLVALSAAVVRYVNWSSDQAWAEFTAAGRSSPNAARRPPTLSPAEAVKRRMPCARNV